MREKLRETWQTLRKWSWHHLTVFLMTFLSYAFFHACRKAFSNIKNTLAKSITPCPDGNVTLYPYETWRKEHMFANVDDANVFLGELDLLFLLAYAIGLYISGMIGDRVNLRYFLAFGMCGSAVVTFCFGYISEVVHMRNPYYYYVLNFLNGLLQSIGWPTCVAVMGNWFSKSNGGLVFGFWSGNASFGNIIGSLIVASCLKQGYEYGMLLNSMLLFCGGLIVCCCLITHPNDVGLDGPDEKDKRPTTVQGEATAQVKAIGFIQALLIPGVLCYALSYACLKLVNYTFFFWLPTYLSQGLHWEDDKSDALSNFYDIGGIVGGILAGVISDMMRVRSPVVCFMLVLSMFSLYVYGSTGAHYTTNVAIMVLTGMLIGGPANTISTAITADLGKHEQIRGSAEALATVTGIIDGTGSSGAAIGQLLIPVINNKAGWHWVFYFLIMMTGLSFVCIMPILWKETCWLRSERKERTTAAEGYQRLPREGSDGEQSNTPHDTVVA